MEIRPDMIFCGCLLIGVFAVLGFILVYEYMTDRRERDRGTDKRYNPVANPLQTQPQIINYTVNHFHLYQNQMPESVDTIPVLENRPQGRQPCQIPIIRLPELPYHKK